MVWWQLSLGRKLHQDFGNGWLGSTPTRVAQVRLYLLSWTNYWAHNKRLTPMRFDLSPPAIISGASDAITRSGQVG